MVPFMYHACNIDASLKTQLNSLMSSLLTGEDTPPDVKVHACIAIGRSAKSEENRRVMHEQELEAASCITSLFLSTFFSEKNTFCNQKNSRTDGFEVLLLGTFSILFTCHSTRYSL